MQSIGKNRVLATTSLGTRSEASRWVLRGSVMGIAAGGVFLSFEMIVAGLTGQSTFEPLRMIASVVLGEGALSPQPTIVLAIVVPVALTVHYALSGIYGAVFGAAIAGIDALRHDRIVLVGAATTFGLLLWLVNFYVIAPIAFPWFSMADPYVQFTAHTFFFGTALGLSLAGRLGGAGK